MWTDHLIISLVSTGAQVTVHATCNGNCQNVWRSDRNFQSGIARINLLSAYGILSSGLHYESVKVIYPINDCG